LVAAEAPLSPTAMNSPKSRTSIRPRQMILA
jgi:hypothetical protein